MRTQVLSLCDRLGVPEVTDVRATSLTTLVQMAAGGLGLTVLPAMAFASRAGAAGLRAVPFGGAAPYRTIALAIRPGTSRRAEIEALADVIRRRRPEGTAAVGP